LYELNFSVHDVSVTLYSVRLRSYPEVLAECRAEVALIEEACVERDLRQWDACVVHEGQSITQAASRSIFSRCATENLSKRAGEVDGMHSELLRHLGDLQRVAASIVQELASSTNP
jgi:hypothetical protein